MRFRSTALFLTLLAATAGFGQSFSSHYYSGAGNGSSGIVSADFDKNGWPDIAVQYSDSSGGGISVRLGTGSGNLGARHDYPLPSANVMGGADIDGDGWTDLVVSSGDTRFLTMINNHDGTFHAGPVIDVGATPQTIEFGDFNRDGRIDFATILATQSGEQFDIEINQGGGSFTTSQIGGPVVFLALGDFNRDGKVDLVTGSGKSFTLWRGAGDGTFVASLTQVTVPDSNDMGSLAVADFNNDGSLDVAVLFPHACGQDCGDNVVYMYKNNGAGSFALKTSFHIGVNPYGTLEVMDLNGDLNMDVILWSGSHFYGYSSHALGHGNWVFDGFGSGPGTSDEADFSERDLNRDSRHDVVMTSWSDPHIDVGLNTGAAINCAAPSSAAITAKICGPANNASVASPVAVKASGNSPAGIQRLEIWVDGHKQYEKFYDQLNKRLTLSAGTHRITVVAVDKYVGSAKSTVTVNVH